MRKRKTYVHPLMRTIDVAPSGGVMVLTTSTATVNGFGKGSNLFGPQDNFDIAANVGGFGAGTSLLTPTENVKSSGATAGSFGKGSAMLEGW